MKTSLIIHLMAQTGHKQLIPLLTPHFPYSFFQQPARNKLLFVNFLLPVKSKVLFKESEISIFINLRIRFSWCQTRRSRSSKLMCTNCYCAATAHKSGSLQSNCNESVWGKSFRAAATGGGDWAKGEIAILTLTMGKVTFSKLDARKQSAKESEDKPPEHDIQLQTYATQTRLSALIKKCKLWGPKFRIFLLHVRRRLYAKDDLTFRRRSTSSSLVIFLVPRRFFFTFHYCFPSISIGIF